MKCRLTEVLIKSLSKIVLKLKVVRELLVVETLVTHSIKSCVVEEAEAFSDGFGIVDLGEIKAKVMNKLLQCFW